MTAHLSKAHPPLFLPASGEDTRESVVILLICILLFFYFNCVFANTYETPRLFTLRSVAIHIPVQGLTTEQLLRQSILYTPKDVVRDGLPWFGTKRDDWKPGARIRNHTGIDIYGDTLHVVAAADGEVIAVGRGKQWGGSITIRHADSVETMYIHITKWLTFKGAHVKAGDAIGLITAPEGNAFQTQLHWSVLSNGKFIDPIPLITKTLTEKEPGIVLIREFERSRLTRTTMRDSLLRNFLSH